MKKMRPETPQEIAMWIEERKKKYPTNASIEKKVERKGGGRATN